MPATSELGNAVQAIWRYPVKSMAGEELSSAQVTNNGLVGDRAYAYVDQASNTVATVRTWAKAMLNYQPRFVREPAPGSGLPGLRITLPDGTVVSTDHAETDRMISSAFGRDLKLTASGALGLLLEFPAGTLGGAHATDTIAPLSGGAPPGTFFDYGSVHLVATSTLRHLQSAYPEGRFDIRRFRPNVIVDTGDSEPFVENSWAGQTLSLGEDVLLRGSIPCPRCVMTTLSQGDLPHDPGILRTVAHLNRRDLGDFGNLPCIGVYAEVVRPGRISRGDAVRLHT